MKSCRNSINIVMVAQSEQYSHLDDLNKKMIEALSEAFESNNTRVDVILQAYERKVSGLHEVMKVLRPAYQNGYDTNISRNTDKPATESYQ